jgi:tetratricopeptide (TPR) repeat protein
MGAWALAVLAGLYVAAIWTATSTPGPQNWGVHLAAFLSPAMQHALIALMVASVAGLALAASRPPATSAKREASRGRRKPKGHREPKQRPKPKPGWGRLWLFLLPLYGVLLYLLRVRTHFLGDGGVWMNILLGGDIDPFSEPLSARAWGVFRDIARAAGWPMNDATFAILPVLCGVASAALAWLLLEEALPGVSRKRRAIAWALFLTMGFTQIYYGYVESYPIASVAIMGYLWLALRHARGADSPWLLGAALALAVGFHLIAIVLYPSYVVAVVRHVGTPGAKAARLVAPLALAPLVLTAAGMRPSQWLRPFETVASAAGTAGGVTLTRPYPILSLHHATDIANALLLVAPVPLLMGLAWALEKRGRIRPGRPATEVLAAAAVAGLAALFVLVLPVAPAQDWDLTAVLILPAAVAAIVAAQVLDAPRVRASSLIALSAASLLAFVAVNAAEEPSIARYKVLLAPDAIVSAYGRGYGHSMLSEFYEDRGALDSALVYAHLALRSEPTNPRYWLREGTILYNQKRYDEAIPKLEESIRRGTSRVAAHYNLGLAFARTHRYADAAAEFRTAMAMDGTNPEYPHHLALMLYDSGYPDSARTMWEDVLRRWPTYALTARALARRFPPGAPAR